jgi:hypothetical protein
VALPLVVDAAQANPCPCDCPPAVVPAPKPRAVKAGAPRHLTVAAGYVGTVERQRNRGPEIDTWNRFCGVPVGSNYCSSFISWCNDQGRVRSPRLRTAWARSWIRPNSQSAQDVLLGRYKPKPGDIVVWVRERGGHVGYVTAWERRSGSTIEANTSSGVRGSQSNGNGVYRRQRVISPFSAFRIVAFTPVET